MVSTRTEEGAVDLRGEACQRIEDRRQPALIGAPGGRGDQAIGLALEQGDAEATSSRCTHPADRRRRDVELVACGGKTAAAGGGLERLDAVEKEQPPHWTSTLMENLGQRKLTQLAPRSKHGSNIPEIRPI